MSDVSGGARDLQAFVARIERLEEEKKTIANEIKDVYGEAKSFGFDTVILKRVIALRKKDEQQRSEEEMILDTYLQALGMIPAFERDESTKSEAKASGEQTEGTPGHQGAGPRREMRVGAASAVLPATSEFTDVTAGETAPKISQASDGSNADVTPLAARGVEESAVSNQEADQPLTGGDHVEREPSAATHQAGPVLVSEPRPAKHPILLLRPHCRHPGEEICGGSGRNHCRSCTAAMRDQELETA